MPTVPDPPPPDWDNTEFTFAKGLTANAHDATNSALKDANGKLHYLFAGKSATSGRIAWYARQVADSGNCPQAKVPVDTYNVIKNGTLNTQTHRIAYNGSNYELRLQRDAGVQVALAVIV